MLRIIECYLIVRPRVFFHFLFGSAALLKAHFYFLFLQVIPVAFYSTTITSVVFFAIMMVETHCCLCSFFGVSLDG